MRIGAFSVDAGALQVESDDGHSTRLTPKAMGVLLALAREPGITLSRDELLDQVWGSVHVTPGVVGHAITALRRAFGDDVEQPAYIETIPRIGYRLIAPVQQAGAQPAEAIAPAPATGETPAPPSPPPPPGSTPPPDAAAQAGAPSAAATEPPLAADGPLPPTAPAVGAGGASPQPAPGATRPPRAGRRMLALVAGLALVVGLAALALAAAAWRHAASDVRGGVLSAETPRRLTFAPGSEATPRLAPGGDWLVYTRRERLDAPPRLFLQSIHGTEPIALEDGGHAERPTWSPNGREIAYVWRPPDRSSCEIRSTSVDGGGPLKLADCPARSVVYLDWNPKDADQIAFSPMVPGSPGGTRIQLLRRGQGWAAEPFDYGPMATPVDLYPRFSPDGRRIAFRRGANPTSDLYVVPAVGGEVTRLTTLRAEINGFDWLPDGSGLVFSSNHEGDRALYALDLDSRRIAPLGIHDASSPDISNRDGSLAFRLEAWRSAVAEYPLDGGERRLLSPSSGRDFSAATSADDATVVFASDRDGSSQLWRLDRADGRLARLTRHDSGRVESPVLSADGQRVLYLLRSRGRHELHEFDLERGVSHLVAVGSSSLRNAIYASDDHSIWYVGWHGDGWHLHACRRAPDASACTGQPTAESAFRVERAQLDGQAALLLTEATGEGHVRAVAEDDLRPLPLAAFSVGEPWRVVGNAVWALETGEDGSPVLVEHALHGGSRRLGMLHGLRPLHGEGFRVSRDGQRLLLPVVIENRSDIGVTRLVPASD